MALTTATSFETAVGQCESLIDTSGLLCANQHPFCASRPHVEPGTYILTVQSKEHVFDSVSKTTSVPRAPLTILPSYAWTSQQTMTFQKFGLITQAHH